MAISDDIRKLEFDAEYIRDEVFSKARRGEIDREVAVQMENQLDAVIDEIAESLTICEREGL